MDIRVGDKFKTTSKTEPRGTITITEIDIGYTVERGIIHYDFTYDEDGPTRTKELDRELHIFRRFINTGQIVPAGSILDGAWWA